MKPSCKNCVHCGPEAHGNIVCRHPSWGDKDAQGAMNEIHPSFASECSDYEPTEEKKP